MEATSISRNLFFLFLAPSQFLNVAVVASGSEVIRVSAFPLTRRWVGGTAMQKRVTFKQFLF